MNRLRLLGFLAVLFSSMAMGQPTVERLALNNIQKGKWEKAKKRLLKAIRKDSVNATARYVFSSYYFAPANPVFQIDSAYKYAVDALADYSRSTQKQRDRMKRFPVDSLVLIHRRMAIDSAGFVRAKKLNTEQAYIDFIDQFQWADQIGLAMELRDEVAYVDALKENTVESYLGFLEKYPNALRAQEARERYEKLLFETKTKDGKLASYVSFIDQYPASPYRQQAELQVFEISTASGKPTAFTEFIKRYPDSQQIAKAKGILYHLLKEKEQTIPSALLTDSLKKLRQLEQGYLVPFLKDGKFGFMNAQGKEIIGAFAGELSSEYLCGNITEELLVAGNRVLARDGSIIFSEKIHELEDLGYGYIFVEGPNCSALVHKSGLVMEDCIQDAKVLDGAFLGTKKNNTWTISTLTGRLLPVGDFEEVGSFDAVITVKQSGKFKLIHKDELAKAADQTDPVFSRLYDEVRRWDDNTLWVRSADRQGLLGYDLKERIPLGKKEIHPAFFGALTKLPTGYKLWSIKQGESDGYEEVRIQTPWIAIKSDQRWALLDHTFKRHSQTTFDSIYFTGPFSVALRADSLFVYVTPETFIPVPIGTSVQFLPGKDSTYFLMVEEQGSKTIYKSTGEKLFSSNYDRIEYAGEDLFLAIRKEKRGLVDLLGKTVVPPEYDAMGNLDHSTVPVLKDKKFGFVDVQHRKEVKPVYEKNLVRYNPHLLIAFKGTFYGLIDWNSKPVTPFEYEEIRYWNDSAALVKRNFNWSIYNFIERKVVADKIKDFRWLRDGEEEKIIIIHQENNYGVISNRKGIILPATYSDIVNLGSPTRPLYFTEKHIEEASIYVVIYYDGNGKLLRRQVFEADDYDRIYCPHN